MRRALIKAAKRSKEKLQKSKAKMGESVDRTSEKTGIYEIVVRKNLQLKRKP